ncbi:hypothetical protein Tco_0749096 [Tanacetum coccineum]|uniref:Uncharacterized protein n=1 Tax=Tanacetum coccineum TaxID=301880 RepID=A0ABQ4Z0B0_9ASTR
MAWEAADHQRQVQLTMALKLLKGLQTQMAEFQRQQGPAEGPAQRCTRDNVLFSVDLSNNGTKRKPRRPTRSSASHHNFPATVTTLLPHQAALGSHVIQPGMVMRAMSSESIATCTTERVKIKLDIASLGQDECSYMVESTKVKATTAGEQLIHAWATMKKKMTDKYYKPIWGEIKKIEAEMWNLWS